jgi:hypothetical protein
VHSRAKRGEAVEQDLQPIAHLQHGAGVHDVLRGRAIVNVLGEVAGVLLDCAMTGVSG